LDSDLELERFENFLDKAYEKNAFDAALIDMLAVRSSVVVQGSPSGSPLGNRKSQTSQRNNTFRHVDKEK
jgi:hypothetical protein